MQLLCQIQLTIIVSCCFFLKGLHGFQTAKSPTLTHRSVLNTRAGFRSSPLFMAENKPQYTREVILREEAESPFRKIRFFLYIALGGGAVISLAVSMARIAAGLNGINTDLLEQSTNNAVIDVVGIVVLSLLYQQDLKAQESRYKRATKGAELANLMVRASSAIKGDETEPETFTTSLASLRRGRGIEKRVVITVAGKNKIDEVLKQAAELHDELSKSDLLIIPVTLPLQAGSPDISIEGGISKCLALPVGNSWKGIIDDEAAEATKQGIDVNNEGICVILKKNGRVGQRTRGIFLSNMVGDVTARTERGMDVRNI